MNHVTLAGLLLDIAGAGLLARSLFLVPAETYASSAARRTFADVAGHEPLKDLDHAREWADTRVGASLLALGFLGQAAGAFVDDGRGSDPVVPYLLAGMTIALAAFTLRGVTRRRELAVFAAQLAGGPDPHWRYNHWVSYAAAYLQRRGP